MSNKKLIMIVLAVLITGLSSCAKKEIDPVSEDVIRQEVIKRLNIDETTTKLNDLTIDSNTVSEDRDIVKATAVIENKDAIVTLKVTLNYVYSDKQWTFSLKGTEFISGVTKTDGSAESALSMVKLSENNNGFHHVMVGNYRQTSPLRQVDFVSERDFCWALYTYQADYTMLETTAIGKMNIKAKYDYPSGWSYALDSWNYIETTQFNGDYTFSFTIQNSDEESWFVEGQILEVHLEGAMTLTLDSSGYSAYKNAVTGTMITEGNTYVLTVEPYVDDMYTYGQKTSFSLKLTFGTETDAYIALVINDGSGHGGEPSPAWWEGEDAYHNHFSVTKAK